jgi:L-phenylalanine/L-methionine N-acetyltransferase
LPVLFADRKKRTINRKYFNYYVCSMIQKATINDLKFVYELFMHPQINPHLLYEQMSMEDFTPIYEKLIATDVLYLFGVNAEMVGMFKFVPQTYRSEHVAYLGSFAIHPKEAGRGLGAKMLHEIIDLANNTGIKRIELSAGAQNKKALGLYSKCGFKEEGVLRKYTYFKSEDRYIDEIMMSYIID